MYVLCVYARARVCICEFVCVFVAVNDIKAKNIDCATLEMNMLSEVIHTDSETLAQLRGCAHRNLSVLNSRT